LKYPENANARSRLRGPSAVIESRQISKWQLGVVLPNPGVTQRLHWSFPDPSALPGTEEERLEGTRKIRDQIRDRVEAWCEEMCGAQA
jgi:hypothetical protein